MMTLEDAIKHAEDKYIEQTLNAQTVKRTHGEHVAGYLKHCACAEEHRQLADWLKELKAYREGEVCVKRNAESSIGKV